jgi:3-oxoacyl-[acyl-carrier protein] reductase
MTINGKNVVVTGGANGIGRATSLELQSLGADICVLDWDTSAIDKLQEESSDVFARVCDVSSYDAVDKAVEEYFKKAGSIDILINCAGIVYNSPLVGLGGSHDVEMWDKVISVNLSGVFYTTLSVVNRMKMTRTKGLVINISSISASGNAGQSAYSAAKAGVNALTVTWAKELCNWGIRVAGIAPGFTDTHTTQSVMEENVIQEWKKKTPLRRFARVDEIVNGIIFIIQNDFFHSRILEIDGGLRI